MKSTPELNRHLG